MFIVADLVSLTYEIEGLFATEMIKDSLNAKMSCP